MFLRVGVKYGRCIFIPVGNIKHAIMLSRLKHQIEKSPLN